MEEWKFIKTLNISNKYYKRGDYYASNFGHFKVIDFNGNEYNIKPFQSNRNTERYFILGKPVEQILAELFLEKTDEILWFKDNNRTNYVVDNLYYTNMFDCIYSPLYCEPNEYNEYIQSIQPILDNPNLKWKIHHVNKAAGAQVFIPKGTIWECSNIGGLVRINGHIIKPRINTGHIFNGYLFIINYKLHLLIAETWITKHDKSLNQIDHIDTNILNNDISNLRWTNQKQNMNNPLTKQHCSDSKKLYKFTTSHKSNISAGNKTSMLLMTEKQRKIRCNGCIKGIRLVFNKKLNAYNYADKNKNIITEAEVDKILYLQGYDTFANKIK